MRDARPLSFPKPSNCLAWLATSACVTVWWLKFWRLTAWSQFCAWGLPCLQTLILWLCWDLWAKEMGQHQRALVCHSRSDPATFSFSKVSHACLSPALCNLPSCCVCRATACDHDILHCCTTSCPSHGQLKGGFETTPYISSLWKWLRLTLAMLKLNYLSTLADLLRLWPVFCACWASAVLHPEVVPSCAVSVPFCDPWWSLKGSLAASGWKVL